MLNVPAYYLTRLNTIFANKTPHENVVKSGVGYHVVRVKFVRKRVGLTPCGTHSFLSVMALSSMSVSHKNQAAKSES